MGELVRALGYLLAGAALGVAFTRVNLLTSLFLLVAASALIGLGYGLDKRSRAEHAKAAATRAKKLAQCMAKGYELLNEIALWSRDHSYHQPSPQGSAAALGAESQAKSEFITKSKEWTDEVAQVAARELGVKAGGFYSAAPVAQPVNLYIHPHLEASWQEIRGRVGWLGDHLAD